MCQQAAELLPAAQLISELYTWILTYNPFTFKFRCSFLEPLAGKDIRSHAGSVSQETIRYYYRDVKNLAVYCNKINNNNRWLTAVCCFIKFALIPLF